MWDDPEDFEDEDYEVEVDESEEGELEAFMDSREAIVAAGWTARPAGFAYIAED